MKRREISCNCSLDLSLTPDWSTTRSCCELIGGGLSQFPKSIATVQSRVLVIHLTLSSISLVCEAERQILALASISEVAGNPAMTTATLLFNISREKALQQNIEHL